MQYILSMFMYIYSLLIDNNIIQQETVYNQEYPIKIDQGIFNGPIYSKTLGFPVGQNYSSHTNLGYRQLGHLIDAIPQIPLVSPLISGQCPRLVRHH